MANPGAGKEWTAIADLLLCEACCDPLCLGEDKQLDFSLVRDKVGKKLEHSLTIERCVERWKQILAEHGASPLHAVAQICIQQQSELLQNSYLPVSCLLQHEVKELKKGQPLQCPDLASISVLSFSYLGGGPFHRPTSMLPAAPSTHQDASVDPDVRRSVSPLPNAFSPVPSLVTAHPDLKSGVSARATTPPDVAGTSLPNKKLSAPDADAPKSEPASPSTRRRSGKRDLDAARNPSAAATLSPATPKLAARDLTSYNDVSEWRQAAMLKILSRITSHRSSDPFKEPVEGVAGYSTMVHRPVDLSTIRGQVESGELPTLLCLKRDLLLMFLNAQLFNGSGSDIHRDTAKIRSFACAIVDEAIAEERALCEAKASASPTMSPPSSKASKAGTSSTRKRLAAAAASKERSGRARKTA